MAETTGAEAPRVRVAWYASNSPGTVRDWLTILHLPYSAWHLSYVLIGAGLAPELALGRLGYTLGAFALAVGIAAHGFDELNGRPLGTSISAPVLAAVSSAALAGAVALGVTGLRWAGWGLAGFVVIGVALVLSYNLELFGGRLHNDHVFALAWGSFPLLTAYFAQTSTIRAGAVLAAAFAYGLSYAQRQLSTEARDLRRRVASVDGERRYPDGTGVRITRDALLRPIERSLVALSWSTCALGVGLVLAKTVR